MEFVKNIFWNTGESRLRTTYRILIQFILFIVIRNLTEFVIQHFTHQNALTANAPSWYLLLLGFARLFPALVSVWLIGRFIDRRSFKDFGFDFNAAWWRDFAFGLGLGGLSMAAIFLIEYSCGWIKISSMYYLINKQAPFIIPISGCLILFICAGIAEELVFRGYQIKNLAEGFNLKFIGAKHAVIMALVFSSTLFRIFHFENPGATVVSTLNIITGGILLGIGYILTKQLAISIGLHISWNFFQGNVFGFPVSGITFPSETASIVKINQAGPVLWTGGSFGPEAGLLGLIIILTGIVLITVWVKMTNKNVTINSALISFSRNERE